MKDYIAYLLEALQEEEKEENGTLSFEAALDPVGRGDAAEDVAVETGVLPPVSTPAKEAVLDLSGSSSLAAEAHRRAVPPADKVAQSGATWRAGIFEQPPPLLRAEADTAQQTVMRQAVEVGDKLATSLNHLESADKRADRDALDAVRKQAEVDVDTFEAVRKEGILEAFDTTPKTLLAEEPKPAHKASALLTALDAMRKRAYGGKRRADLERTERAIRNTASERVEPTLWKEAAEEVDLEALDSAVKWAKREETVPQRQAGLLWTRLQQEGRLARFAVEGGRERVATPTLPTSLQPAWGMQADLSALDRAAERDARGYDKGFSLF